MNPGFNSKKDVVKNIREDDVDYTSNSSNNLLKDKMTKNLYKIAIVTAVIVVVLFLLSSVVGGNKSYNEIENIMVSAAKKYFNNNKNTLPRVTGSTVEVSLQKLINEDYMKDISKYKKGANCAGKVVVENNDDNYIYVSYLDCGSNYKTTEFYRKVTDYKSLVSSGAGLYSNNGEYIFRGENVNNYVNINDGLWRIVKVTSDNQIVLVKQDRVSRESFSWDDRFNSSKNGNVGINDFNVSRLKDYYDLVYQDNMEDVKIFTNNIKAHLVNHKYCIGKRSIDSTSSDNSLECSSLSEDLKVGGLTVSDYMMASLDSGCTTATSEACQNYNYLVNDTLSWWLITADNSNTFKAFYVDTMGSLGVSNCNNTKKIRPVIYLNSRTMYQSGDGTIDKPYKIK